MKIHEINGQTAEFNKWIRYETVDGYIMMFQIPLSEANPKFKNICVTILISDNELKSQGWKALEDISEDFLHQKFISALLSAKDLLQK